MFNGNISPPVITKEHGSWAVLFVPMLVNACVVRRWSVDILFVGLAALGVFLSYVPAQLLLRHYSGYAQKDEKLRQAKFWFAAYMTMTAAFAVPLLMKGDVLLLAIGAAGTISFLGNFFFVKRYSKMIATDLIAVAGLTLSGPSVYYVLVGKIDATALSLYVLNFLFFGGSVFYVHMKIRASASKKGVMGWAEKFSFGKNMGVPSASAASLCAARVWR